MKTEVYSWRVSAQKKADLEAEARREGISLAKLLEQVTAHWLSARRDARNGDEAEQAALKRRVMATVGTISGPRIAAETAREVVQRRIRQRHAEESNAARRSD
jgi:hypothetical protein